MTTEERRNSESYWTNFRNSAANDILCACCSGIYKSMDVLYAKKRCEEAISYADELVRQLKPIRDQVADQYLRAIATEIVSKGGVIE